MTAADWDWDDEPEYLEDCWDDDPVFVKEEPNCYACYDSGFVWSEGGQRCRSCQFTGLQYWWWRLTWRIRDWRSRRRMRRDYPRLYDDEPPF